MHIHQEGPPTGSMRTGAVTTTGGRTKAWQRRSFPLSQLRLGVDSCDFQLAFVGFILCQIWFYFLQSFPCIYMSLFVRDECERLVKNQASKKYQCNSRLANEKLMRRVSCERPRVKHMTRSWRVLPDCQIHEYFMRKAISRGTHKTLCLAKRKSVLPNSLPTLYIHSLPMKCKECFSERKP